jgi:hypothetical protein
LDPIAKNHRVSKRVAALERVSSDTNTFWTDARRQGVIVLLQDHVRHVGESVDGCQRSLTTMFSDMLPRNPPPKNFGQLLEVFKTSVGDIPNRYTNDVVLNQQARVAHRGGIADCLPVGPVAGSPWQILDA